MNREAEIFAEVLELDEPERSAFVARTCDGDAALRNRIEALLRGHARAQRVFAAPATARVASSSENIGTAIDRYTLLEKIGEGGCGVVWRAEQREPLRREVALKVIKLGMDTREVIARFEVERQALALMDHPHIARVFDGGATATGRPYFVMEFVRGVPITRYCDDAHLSITARLKLFIEVCHAIQHAHQKGIIHRDLKPSNILVADDRPSEVERLDPKPLSVPAKTAAWGHAAPPLIQAIPKVIDFGIAKATQGQLPDATVFTAREQFIGTPAYMSPEQAALGGLDIDTRSDIYSLGVLLYELLTSHTPFDVKTLGQGGVDRIRQHIREAEPPRPSTRLDALDAGERATLARRRDTGPAELSVILRGDLDWIVMRCLEKDRTRRYDTANGLAMDIQRHLRNEAVLARPPSTAYLLRKLVRRNRPAFAGIVAVFSVLVIGAAVATWLAIRATRAEKAERRLLDRVVEEHRLGLKRSSLADFRLGSRFLDEGKSGEGLAYLVRSARSDPANTIAGPRLIAALASRNFLLPERAPLQLPAAVRWIACNSDGSAVFVLTDDGIVRVLDGSGSRVVREYSFPKRVRNVALADANRGVFVVQLEDNSLLVCDAATGGNRTTMTGLEPEISKTGYPRLSMDGRWLAAASEATVRIWDAATGVLRAAIHPAGMASALSADRGMVHGVQFSPDGRRIATVGRGNSFRIWSVPDGAPLTEPIALDTRQVVSMRFSPDGSKIAVGTMTGAELRDGATGAKVGPSFPHDAQCYLALFTPDGSRLITASADRTVKVWNIGTGQLAFPALLHPDQFPGPLHSGPTGRPVPIMISNDGKVLLTCSVDGLTRVWSLETGRLVAEPALQQERAPHSALSPDGARVLAGTERGFVFPLQVTRGSARPLEIPRDNQIHAVGFMGAPPARLRRFTDRRMEVIDAASGREVAGGFDFPEPTTEWVTARSDGRYLAVWTKRKRHEAWEVIDGRVRVVPLQDAPEAHTWHQFSPAGDLLAMKTYSSREIQVWSLRTGRRVTPPLPLESLIFAFGVNFSPDGKRLAAGSSEGAVRIWDVDTSRALFDLKSSPGIMVNRVAFSPDGTRLATTNSYGEVRLWDGADGRPVSPRLFHRTRADPAVFSPDSQMLATGSHDGTLRLWNARDGTPIGEPMAYPGVLLNVQFDTNGSRIAAVSTDGTARIWDTRAGLPLTDPMRHGAGLEFVDQMQPTNGKFSPADGRFLCTFTPRSIFLWPAPPDAGNLAAPEWLLRLATICAGKRVTVEGIVVDASEEVAKLDEVRREIAALPAGAPFAEWGRWFLADPATRSIAPGFTITPAEAEKLAAERSERKS